MWRAWGGWGGGGGGGRRSGLYHHKESTVLVIAVGKKEIKYIKKPRALKTSHINTCKPSRDLFCARDAGCTARENVA